MSDEQKVVRIRKKVIDLEAIRNVSENEEALCAFVG